MLSLNTDNTSTSAATTAEAIILEEIIKPPQLIEIQSLLPLDIDEQSQPVQSTQKTWNMLKMQPLLIPYTLIILLTMVMQIVVFDSSYDYLNSFAFSPDNDDDDDEYDNGKLA